MEKIYKGEIQRLLPIFQAIADGRIIQVSENGNDWLDIDGEEEGLFLNTLIDNPQCYRIKPEPKYRPFANAEECLAEMQKHQPFGWITYRCAFFHVIYIEDKLIGYGSACGTILHSKFNDALEEFKFADGLPFGVKLDE